VLAKNPGIAYLGARLRWGVGNVNLFDDALLDRIRGLGGKAIKQRQDAWVVNLQVGKQRRQLLAVRNGHRRERIEGGKDERLLLWVQVNVRHGDRSGALRKRQANAKVAVNKVARRTVNENGLHPADLVKDARQSVLLSLRVDAPVCWVGQQLIGGLFARAYDS
jgi:hypothetical protein